LQFGGEDRAGFRSRKPAEEVDALARPIRQSRRRSPAPGKLKTEPRALKIEALVRASKPYAEMLSLSNASRAMARKLLWIRAFHYRPSLLLDVILSAGPVLRSKTELSEGSLHFEIA